MENLINWFEIPATDFNRAVSFYKTVLNTSIEEIEMGGMKMGLLPTDGHNVSGAIVAGDGCVPSEAGSRVYLNGGNDLNIFLARVKGAGGIVVVPKTEINPEFGYFGLFKDSEGNLVAIHSLG